VMGMGHESQQSNWKEKFGRPAQETSPLIMARVGLRLTCGARHVNPRSDFFHRRMEPSSSSRTPLTCRSHDVTCNPNACSLGPNHLFCFSSYRVFEICFCNPNQAQGTVQMTNWKPLVFSQLISVDFAVSTACSPPPPRRRIRCIMVQFSLERAPSFSARPSLEFLAKC
jgi:hypothetical protein